MIVSAAGGADAGNPPADTAQSIAQMAANAGQ